MSAPDSRRLPRDQVESVVKALYSAADRLDWEHQPPSVRTAQYDDWVTDAEIGGILTRYMSAENARSWIKDGPMKEYGRARLGAGRYAKYGTPSGPSPEQLAVHALGTGASVIDGSIGVKPFHCIVGSDSTTTYLVWESAQNLRHLVWACINYLASHSNHEACILILETLEHPVTQAEKARHTRIAERCSISIKYYRLAARRPTPSDGAS